MALAPLFPLHHRHTAEHGDGCVAAVSSAQSGTIIGLDMGIGSGVRIFAPLVGGAVQSDSGVMGVAWLCSALFVGMAMLSAALMDVDEGAAKRKSA